MASQNQNPNLNPNSLIHELSKYTYSNTDHLFTKLDTLVRVVNIYDGDTCTIVFKVGDHYYKHNVRLYGIDTCEMKSKNDEQKQKAIQAKQRLFELITKTKLDSNHTKKQLLEILNNQAYIVRAKINGLDKYGRLLCELYDIDQYNKSYSAILLEENLAYIYDGGTKKLDFVG